MSESRYLATSRCRRLDAHLRGTEDKDMRTRIDLLIKKGNAYLAEGMFAKAIKTFTRAIATNPQRPAAYCRRAQAYYARAQAFVGKEPCDTARHAETYFRRAVAYQQLDDDARTLEDLDACMLADPAYADACLEKGLVFFSQERYEEARQEIDQAIALDPTKADYYTQRAMATAMPAYATRDEEALYEALGFMDEAIRIDPGCAEFYFDRGLIYGVLGDSEQEFADFSTTIALDPGYASAYRQRFECLLDSGRKEEAVRDWVQYCVRTKKAVRFGMPSGKPPIYSVN